MPKLCHDQNVWLSIWNLRVIPDIGEIGLSEQPDFKELKLLEINLKSSSTVLDFKIRKVKCPH